MARRYYKRRKKRNDDPLVVAAVLAVLVGGMYIWQLQQDNPLVLVWLGIVAVLLVAAVVSFVVWKQQREQQKLRALDIAQIDTMDPLEFERYVGKLLTNQGYKKVRTTERFDYGVDVLAEKDDIKWGVQVKRYSKMVRAEAVRQVYTALVRYKCDRAMVVTNSTFSRPARELAADNNCLLVDRDMLAEWIVDFQNSKQ